MPQQFSKKLLSWYRDNTRPLPWKEDRDPYKIWISEIILQQTRVEQGTPYYLRFIEAFPDLESLARATEDQVLKLWEGLGYYSRARNLHFTAKYINDELNGVFPNEHEEILKLKGVGPYTAAAIASFAYGLSHPVVDGNVLRLVSRYFGIEESIDSATTKKNITELMQQAIRATDPAIFNQAIMDKGALICTPKKTKCEQCILAKSCYAFANDKVATLPKRSKKIKKTKRYIFYYFVQNEDSTYIRRREHKGIWQGLYELPFIEVAENEFNKDIPTTDYILDHDTIECSDVYRHLLSHQTLHIKFIHAQGKISDESYSKVQIDKLDKYAFPKVLLSYFKDISRFA